MTKQMKAAMAAMLMVGTVAAYPQAPLSTTTKTEKVAPGETKTTVITKEQGAAGSKSGSKKRRTSKKSKAKKAPAAESATSRELRELRATQQAQQAQIDALTQANAAKDAALAQAQTAAQTAETQAQAATAATQTVSSTVQANTDAVQALKSNVTDLQTANTGLATTISNNKQELNEKIESPTTIHYKGVTITPVAFFAFEGVYRQRSINSDINTPFNTTPFPGSNEGHISELNFTGRQSRLGGLFEGNAGTYKLSGYFEADFLSSGTTSNSNQSNSYSLRQRQIWGKGETKGGFAVTGGQMWSLVTENGKSTDNRTEKLPNTVDPQYMVGFNWARQPAIRFQQKFGHPVFGTGFTMAVALENAQIQLASTLNAPANFIFGGTGTSGGLLNAFNGTYANNVAPDGIVKFAFDAKYSHVEFGGLARFFRDEYSRLGPNGVILAPAVIQKSTTIGGGVFGSARVSLNKFADVAVQAMAGPGVGRYGSSQLGDVTTKPDGELEPIKNYHGLFSLETHPGKKLDVYAYYGGEYNQRTLYPNYTGQIEGYGVRTANDSGCYALSIVGVTATGTGGAPGIPVGLSCASPTRYIQEGMVGFTYRVASSPKYGRLQYQTTYSYLTKNTWSGILNTATGQTGEGRATNGMVHFGMRYYIP